MSASSVNMDKISNRRRYDSNGGRIVLPEPANSKTYMESVVSFVKGLSQVYSQTTPVDEKEPIVWVKYFSYADTYGYEGLEQANASVLLVLGYSNGMQMWNLLANGEAQEMFSLRDGPVKTACLLPPPPPSYDSDDFQARRPLMAICLATDSKQMFAGISIQSLSTGDQVKKLQFPSDVMSVHTGPSPLFLVVLKDSIHAFHLRTLECVFVINGCSPCHSNMANPLALGTRWLIYSPALPLTNFQSSGGIIREGGQSYVTSVLNAAKTISKGISTVGDTVNWLASKSRLTSSLDETSASSMTSRWGSNRSMSGSVISEGDNANDSSGLVTVLDVVKMQEAMQLSDSDRKVAIETDFELAKEAVVAHFVAHVNQCITHLELSPSGRLLATADDLGHEFHIFSILPHPGGSPLAAVHHLYRLWRGQTPAEVQELRFSWDSRWFVASTLRGTCHIFPVAPYGGSPNVRTHTSDRVVNRSSTFHKSAGLDEMEYFEPPTIPSHRQLSENSSAVAQTWQSQHRVLALRSLASSNPRLPPYPNLVYLNAVDHIRLGQAASAALPGVLPSQAAFMTSQTATTDSATTPMSRAADVVIATRFLQSTRNEKTGSGANSFSGSSGGGSQRLLIASSTGYLSEYLLEPRPQQGLSKVSDESPVEAVAKEGMCWSLQRQTNWSTLPLVLPIKNPLIAADKVCRRHYDLTRSRMKKKLDPRPLSTNREAERHDREAPTNGAPDLAFSTGPQHIRVEQPRSREKHRDPRSIHPGSAPPRSGKHSKLKKSSGSDSDSLPPPTSVEMQRNGNTRSSSDDEGGLANIGEDLKGTAGQKVTPMVSEEWLAQVEMVTHEGPARRLWMGPQFHFKKYVSTGSTHILSSVSSALLSNQQHQVDPYSGNSCPQGGARESLYEEELDVHSLAIHSMRSDPVPTPAPRPSSTTGDDSDSPFGCCVGATTIEAGSGNFDRAAHMLEITAFGSLDERRNASYGTNGCEDKLRERIADAMTELNGEYPNKPSSHHFTSSGKHRLAGRANQDCNDEYGSLPVETDHFDFTHLEASSSPPLHGEN